MVQRIIQIGAGGFAERWCREFLPTNVADGLIEVVGVIDRDAAALERVRNGLNLAPEQCFTDPEDAFSRVEADFCSIVVPPAFHEYYVDLAIANNIHILSEKPLADTIESSARIARKVAETDLKMAVTMSHRFDQDKMTFSQVVKANDIGRLNMLHCRLSADMRRFDSWRRFRHEMRHPLLIEGAIHHIDYLASLVGSPCRSVYATTWKPEWAEYAGDTDASLIMVFDNGVRATFEGSCASPVGVSDWYFEQMRADGSDGIALLDHREVEIFRRRDTTIRQSARAGEGQKVPPVVGTKWLNNLLIEQFVNWLEGGVEMETTASANFESTVILFAAIESADTGKVVEIGEFKKRLGI